MPFNSFQYFLFLPVVYLLFFFVGERARWIVLLAASLLFYAALKVPYLLVVLALVAMTTYAFGIWLDQASNPKTKRVLLGAGIALNVLILVVMKYLPFLSENLLIFSSLLSFDVQIQPITAFVAIGVSYYVFQAISYLFDIYLEIERPERHFGYFALYLAFFPKLLQGPIERAGDFLPQLKALQISSIYNFRSGILLIVCGLFKKVIIADRLSLFVDPVYADVQSFAGADLVLATYAYALQIYFDFSGYTDMALGPARIFNISLSQNFNSPYLATSVADFWRRWHITFSRWILDYIFKPLQMRWRNGRNWGTASALVVAFLVSGIWHGASWGFVIWGGLHGLYLACSVFYRPFQKKLHKALGIEGTRGLKVWKIFVTFNLVCIAWIFFRASNLVDAWYVVTHLFIGTGSIENYLAGGIKLQELVIVVVSMGFLTALTYLGKRQKLLKFLYGKPLLFRLSFYFGIIIYCLVFYHSSNQSFSYIRF